MSPLSIWVKLGIVAICVLGVTLGILHIYDMGYDAGKDEVTNQLLKANQKLEAAQSKLQAKSDAAAETSSAAADIRLNAILAKISNLRLATPAGKPTTALPKDCVFDDARVKWGNEP